MPKYTGPAAIAGTILIALGAFWLSFTALQDLAIRARVPVSQAWVWPLVVDMTIVVCTLAVVVLREGRWYAWCLLALSAGISLSGNAAHAWSAGPVAVAVATVPPMMLLAVTHLTVLLTRAPQREPAVATSAPTVTPLFGHVGHRDDSGVPDLAASFREARRTA